MYCNDTIFCDAIVERVRSVVGHEEQVVPLHRPEFSGNEWEFVKDCLDTGWVSSVGAYVDRFEAAVANACGCEHGVATVNGTAALHVSLLVAGVQPGDEVLLPSFTFVATANAVCHAGGVPHFIDSDPLSIGIMPSSLDAYLERITVRCDGRLLNRQTGARIAAIIPMHVFGHPVRMDELSQTAARYGLTLVEDAAEALGSSFKGRPCGSFGALSALSFNGNKILTTGGGGAIVTNDAALAGRARHLSTTAKVAHRWVWAHDEVAFNYRLPNVNAAIGCAQLEQLQDRIRRKRQLAARYSQSFRTFEGASFLDEPPDCRSNFWLNALVLSPERAMLRDQALQALNDAGLACRPGWTLMHRLPMFTDSPRAPLPVAEDLERRIICLPSSAYLSLR